MVIAIQNATLTIVYDITVPDRKYFILFYLFILLSTAVVIAVSEKCTALVPSSTVQERITLNSEMLRLSGSLPCFWRVC
jgi:hypothetical protein